LVKDLRTFVKYTGKRRFDNVDSVITAERSEWTQEALKSRGNQAKRKSFFDSQAPIAEAFPDFWENSSVGFWFPSARLTRVGGFLALDFPDSTLKLNKSHFDVLFIQFIVLLSNAGWIGLNPNFLEKFLLGFFAEFDCGRLGSYFGKTLLGPKGID
jgi:hypothetical protein